MKSLLLTNDPDTARNTLPAGFVAEEGGDPEKNLPEVDRFIKQHDYTGTQRRADRPRSLECERHIKFLGRNESTGGTTQQDCLETAVACDAARKFNHVAQRSPEWELVDARPNHVTAKAK